MFIAWLVGVCVCVCVLVNPFFYLFLTFLHVVGKKGLHHSAFELYWINMAHMMIENRKTVTNKIRPHVRSDSIKSRRVLTWNGGPGSVVCSNVRP